MKPLSALLFFFASLHLLLLATPVLASDAADSRSADSAAAQLSDLNKKALVQLRSRHFDAAKEILLEALVLAKDAGLASTPAMARTYVQLAALYVNGEKSRDKGVNQLMLALKIDPGLTIPPELDTPALKSATLLARRRLAGAANPEGDSAPHPAPVAPAVPASAAATVQAAATAQDEPVAVPAPNAPTTVAKRGRGGHKVMVDVADPDLPARIPAPLYCPLPFEIPPGQDMVVRCLTQKQQRKSAATLYYRPEGAASEDFIAMPMSRSPKGWLQATIPGEVIKNKSLGYYVQARVPGKNGDDQTLYLARPDAPNAFMIKEGADASFDPDRENILDTLNVTIADEEDSFRNHRRGPGAIWVSLAGGSGAAYHSTEAVDSGDTSGGTPIRSLGGLTAAGLLQTELEIGYQFTKNLSFSAMGRYQYAPPNSSGYTGKPILSSALAGYVRGRYAFLTAGNFQTHLSAGIGGGNSFLVVVSKQCDANSPTAGCKLTHSDTLHGGPVGILLGLGAAYHLSRNFAVFIDVNELATVPKFMALTEINLGFAVAYGLDKPSVPTAEDGVVSEKPAETGEDGAAVPAE
jgi:hypothetical protein